MTDAAEDRYCALPLALYACRPDRSRGRLYPEPESSFRTCFQRDRDRIIHSAAFRRLKHKTQVFVYHEGDHYRTRLTHTLEVAQIARTLARALCVDEDLAEAVALAHDLGHTPFAHVGEDTLDECMADVGGYDHNDQSLRVLTVLERKYPGWPGLNLTWETLEGVVKHNGPVAGPVPETVRMVQGMTDLRLDTYASVEAQAAAISDDIAYNNHDVEDGLTAGLFTLDRLQDVRLIREVRAKCESRHPGIGEDFIAAGIVREMIGAMVEDVLAEAQKNLKDLSPRHPDEVRAAGRVIVGFSPAMNERVEELRKFLWDNMYRHPQVTSMRTDVTKIVSDLYKTFMTDPAQMPDDWRTQAENAVGKKARARVVADYIAGMTDRYAIRAHERIFGVKWNMH